jgi:hypothetical protein
MRICILPLYFWCDGKTKLQLHAPRILVIWSYMTYARTEEPPSLGHCVFLGLAAQQKLQRPPNFDHPPLHA